MGRKPKPTHLKVISGTLQKCRQNRNEPKPKSGIPEAPAHLEGLALQEWNRISKELDDIGVLTTIDGTELAAYCVAYQRWVGAETQLKLENLTITTQKGNVIQNPLVGIANKAIELMHKLLVEFGMTPSSRAKVGGKRKEEKKSPWAEF